jgi:hypothetical protein
MPGFNYQATATYAAHTTALQALAAQISADGFNSALINGAIVQMQNQMVQLQNIANSSAKSGTGNVFTMQFAVTISGSAIYDQTFCNIAVFNAPPLVPP